MYAYKRSPICLNDFSDDDKHYADSSDGKSTETCIAPGLGHHNTPEDD